MTDFFINVTDAPYGAVGDGDANDTDALQDAINDAAGATVVIPPGTYKIQSPLTISNSVRIIGSGATITHATQNTFEINESASIDFVHISGLNATSSGGGRFFEFATSNVTIQDCTLTNLVIHMVRSDSERDVIVRNVQILRNTIRANPAATSNATGIQVGNALNVWIGENIVTGAQHDGIQVTFEPSSATSTATTTAGAKTVTVGSGTLFAVGDIVAIPGAGDSDHSSALYATVESISGNILTLDRAATAAVTDAAIHLGSGNITIRGNTCYDNGDDGIDTFSGGRNTIVEGNKCYGNSLFGIQVKAILSEDSVLYYNYSEGALVTGNHVFGNGSSGIYIKADGVIVSNNQVEENVAGGIQVDAASTTQPVVRTVKVKGNLVRNQPGFGIYVATPVLDADVSGNTLYLCGSSVGSINAALRFRGRSGRICGNIVIPQTTSSHGFYLHQATSGVYGTYIVEGNRVSAGATSQDFQIVAQAGDTITLANNASPSAAIGSAATYWNSNNTFDTFAGSISWTPGSLADGAGVISSSVTVTGAAFGDSVDWGAPGDTQGLIVTAWVSGSNTVKLSLQNETGGNVTAPSGTWRVRVRKRYGA